MVTDKITLNYWVREWQDLRIINACSVTLSRTQTIEDLAAVIKNRYPEDLGACTPYLYKPRDSVPGPWKENLAKFILSEDAELLENVVLTEAFPEVPNKFHIHIIVDAPQIGCWIRGGNLDASFSVSIQDGATTSQLKKYIRKTQSKFKKVDVQDIGLYRISGGENELRESLAKTGDGEPLDMDILMANFAGVPVLDPLRVVVEDVRVVSRGIKRKRKDDHGVEKRFLAKAKLANIAPPKLARRKYFKKWRKSSKGAELVDHRCLYDGVAIIDRPHISLQYEGFGHFIDIFHGAKDVPGMESVSSTKIGPAVEVFAERMSLMYDDEHAKMTRGLDALNKVFSVHTDGLSSAGILGEKFCSDGHHVGPHGVISFIPLFRNELGTTIPDVELAGHFAHSIREAATSRGSYSLIHCLGLTVIGTLYNKPTFHVQLTILLGHYVTFYGMIYNDREGGWQVDPLTPGLSCIPGKGHKPLYNAFIAALVLLDRIDRDAMQLLANPPAEVQGSCVLPYISNLSCPGSQSPIKFKIAGLFPSPASNLYIAETTTEGGEEETIVVKFTKSYSYELHKFCADRGHAPKLLGFQRLPGGFFGIAMELVKRVPSTQIKSGWETQLQNLVQSFHAEDLVHGDLHMANVIISEGNKVILIDFDWAGKEGEVYYPSGTQLNPLLLAGRKSTDLKITKDDDLRVMCNMLQIVGLDCGYCTRS